MKEDESWEDPKIYFERLEKFASSLGYKYDDEGNGFPTYDMLMEIERLRQDVSFLLEFIDDEDFALRSVQSGMYNKSPLADRFRRMEEGRD
jgi:hypothetical protein